MSVGDSTLRFCKGAPWVELRELIKGLRFVH